MKKILVIGWKDFTLIGATAPRCADAGGAVRAHAGLGLSVAVLGRRMR
jgi:hypothetical protein